MNNTDRKPIKTKSDLINEIIEQNQQNPPFTPILRNCDLYYDIKLPILNTVVEELNKHYVSIDSESGSLHFINCVFHSYETIRKQISGNLEFKDCEFHELDFSDVRFKGKVRFRNCTFNKVNLNNTSFDELADFWRCTFKLPITFFKTDFNTTTVFSGVTFEKNVLFTYSLIRKLIIFRGTTFQKGLDLSLAIISGEISCFDMKIDSFPTKSTDIQAIKTFKKHPDWEYSKRYEYLYDDAVSSKHEIPNKNKRETFRILKQTLENQKNLVDSIKFRVLEKKSLFKEVLLYFFCGVSFYRYKGFFRMLYKWLTDLFEIFNLGLNYLSNLYGSSYQRALIFILIVGGLFFNLSITNTSKFEYTLDPNKWDWNQGIQFFTQFLLPTHKFTYLGNEATLSREFYIYDFLGRLFVGYGIYQFIQAFRKFK